MENNKISDFVKETMERQISVETAKKDIINLKSLLNSIETKVSQYNMELKSIEDNVENLQEDFRIKVLENIKIAEENKNDAVKNYDTAIEILEGKKVEIESAIIAAKITYEGKIETTQAEINNKIQEYQKMIDFNSEELKKIESKRYLFKQATKEKDIEGIKGLIANYQETINDFKEIEKNKLEKIEKEYSDSKDIYKKELESVKNMITEKLDAKQEDLNSYDKQLEIFNNLNENVDIDTLTWFNKDSLNDLVKLFIKIKETEKTKLEVKEAIEKSLIEKTETIEKITQLEEKVDKALKERENFRNQVNTTATTIKEGAEKGIGTIINGAKSKLDQVKEAYNEATEEVEEKDKEIKTDIFEDILTSLTRTKDIMKSSAEMRQSQSEEIREKQENLAKEMSDVEEKMEETTSDNNFNNDTKVVEEEREFSIEDLLNAGKKEIKDVATDKTIDSIGNLVKERYGIDENKVDTVTNIIKGLRKRK